MTWVAGLTGPAPRVGAGTGQRIGIPHDVLDVATVDPAALALRDHEIG